MQPKKVSAAAVQSARDAAEGKEKNRKVGVQLQPVHLKGPINERVRGPRPCSSTMCFYPSVPL